MGTSHATRRGMATITKTTVELEIGQYHYRAEMDGNDVRLYRDALWVADVTWNGARIEPWPDVLSTDARDGLQAAILHNLGKAWRAKTETFGQEMGVQGSPVFPSAPKTSDAANHGQMGNEKGRPARQGEAEVGVGGPGFDPKTGELGGQAIKPGRRTADTGGN